MGVLFDYFAAPDDDAAGTVLDLAGGPGESSFPTVAFKGIDPVVQLGTLESLLTGVDYETVVAGDRSGEAVAVADDGERVVVTVTDELLGALSTAAEPRLRAVARTLVPNRGVRRRRRPRRPGHGPG